MSKKLADLFWTTFKIGLFTFGGGYAMLPLLESELVEKKHWMEGEEFLDMAAIAESSPGPIAVNCATYVGYKTAGFWGSLVSTIGICLPSFIIIYLISLFFDAFLSLTFVSYAFKGIQVCVVYLILSSGIKMLKKIKKTPFSIIIVSAVTLCMVTLSLFSVSFSAIFYILICGFLGVAVYLVSSLHKTRRTKK